MAFYPIYQTYGQLSGSVFYATGKTGLYSNIGIIFLIIGLPISYLLMAPHQYFGFELGSVGLAIKMVLLAVLGINVQLWYNTKLLNLSFWEFLSHQIYTVVIFIILGIIAIYLSNTIFNKLLIKFMVSGIIYTILFITVLFIAPSIYFTSRSELKGYIVILGNLFAKRVD
jgi:hypothetical protein